MLRINLDGVKWGGPRFFLGNISSVTGEITPRYITRCTMTNTKKIVKALLYVSVSLGQVAKIILGYFDPTFSSGQRFGSCQVT